MRIVFSRRLPNAMKIAIVQPYFFPYLGYFQLIHAVDRFVVFDDVAFMKKKWINRNSILIGGKSSTFTIPLRQVSQNKLIRDVEIANDLNWKSKLLRSFQMAYKKAPYFGPICDLIETLLNSGETRIGKLAANSLITVCKYLDIDTNFEDSSTIYCNAHLKGQDRIIDICKREGADWYINPIGGMELYVREDFDKNRIRLNFIKTLSYEYKQYNHAFVPSLSMIDVLMFNPKEKIRELLDRYELV